MQSGPGLLLVRSSRFNSKLKDLDLVYNLYTKFWSANHPPSTTKLSKPLNDFKPLLYDLTSNHVPLILPFKMTFRTTFRTIFRTTFKMAFKTWDFRGVSKEVFEVDFEGNLKGSSRGLLRETWRETWRGFPKRTSEGSFRQAQVRLGSSHIWSSPGLVQFKAQI